jgi:HSP20 family protein
MRSEIIDSEGGTTVATLVRWEPIRELATLQTEMSRLMNGIFEGNGRAAQEWVPAVDVWENERELVYAFDLPGVSEDEIAVELHDDTLTVTASRERAAERSEDGFVRFERRFGTFRRAVGVPAGVTEEDVTADYRDGVLELRVAKPEAPKPRRIKLGGGHATIDGGSET